jgi:thymidylate kinase
LVSAKNLTVIEGSYSIHPEIANEYDIRVFLTVSPEEQLRRIRARNGKNAERFQQEWIPLEEKYFDSFKVQENCDLCFDTGAQEASPKRIRL